MKGYEQYGNFVLRLGLGLFILIWGLSKFMQKEMWVKMYPMLYGFNVTAGIITIVGIVQIAIAAMVILGWKTKLAAWVGFLMQLSTTIITLKRVISPFGMVEGDPVGPNIILFATVPILAAWFALACMGSGKLWKIE